MWMLGALAGGPLGAPGQEVGACIRAVPGSKQLKANETWL